MEGMVAFLKQATAQSGIPGREQAAGDVVLRAFERFSDDVWRDAMGNCYARMGGAGPRVLVAAHIDLVGLMISAVEEDGFLSFVRCGGTDPRILPGMEVTIHTSGGDYYGLIGAKPPHVLSEEDRKRPLTVDELFIDVGMSAQKARQLISVGDQVTLNGALMQLGADTLCARALDDRAGIAVMLQAMARLRKTPCEASVVFMASVQEEIGSYGAKMGAYAMEPDLAIAIDVCHAHTHGAPSYKTVPFEKVSIGWAPVLNRRLTQRLCDTAKEHTIEYSLDISGDTTSTDADQLSVSRLGVPTVLLGLPLRYMHTTVELAKLSALRDAGRLLYHFVHELV